MTTTRTMAPSEIKVHLAAVELNGTSSNSEQLRRIVRGGGGILLDKDGVFTRIDNQLEAALVQEFKVHSDEGRGIVYGFDRDLVYKLFGIDPRYNDGPTPILALMALNLEASQMAGKTTANQLLAQALRSAHASDILDALIAKHSEAERQFVQDHMYWWRENGGFMHRPDAASFIQPYVASNGISSRDAAIALVSSGIPVAIITNAPKHDLHAAGFTTEDLELRITTKGVYEEGKIMVLTREDFGVERMKPDPYAFHYAAGLMGVSVERSIYVGDTISDIRFARNAGAIPVAVESGMGSKVHLEKEYSQVMIFPDLPTVAAGLLRES